MFLRIYVSLLLSSAFAAALCYGFYQWQYQHRLQQHHNVVFSGSAHLIAQGLNRHKGERRTRWLGVVQKLLGAKITVYLPQTVNPSPAIRIEGMDEKSAQLHYEVGNLGYSFKVTDVGEQHFRLMAILLSNELGRVKAEGRKSRLEELSEFFIPELSIVPIDTLKLDGQQLSRVKRFDVVVSESHVGSSYTEIYSRLPNSDVVLKVGPIENFTAATVSVMAVIILLGILITGAVGYMLVRRLEQRLSSIEQGISDFARDPVHLSLEDQRTDAIGQLADSVNGMSQRIHHLVSDQKQMLQAISHELRTPISRLKFRLEIMEGSELTATAEKALQGVRSDISEMDNLITEAVSFNKGASQIHPKRFSILDVVKEVIANMEVEYGNVTFDVSDDQDSQVVQDKTLTRRVLLNLIQNACKYGNGMVKIQVVNLSQHVNVYVQDNGSGIDIDRRQSVFSPFTRLEVSRNKETGGIGLGLAVVKNICEILGYRVLIKDSELGGASFELSIPKGEEH